MASSSVKDRRKYQRVLVEASSKNLEIEIVGFGKTLVFDMSYSGAAFAQPKEKSIEIADGKVTLHLKAEVDEAKIPAKVIRISSDAVAVEFDELDVGARIIIDRIVTDRIIGINMMFIDPKHYSEKSEFSHWFHGPKESNLYLWWNGGVLEKAQFESDLAMLIYEDDSFIFENKLTDEATRLNNQQIALKVWSIVEQMEQEITPLIKFKEILKQHVQA